MNVVIINCFPNLEHSRTEPIRKILNAEEYNVFMITSDFDHFKKKKLIIPDDGIIQVSVPSYKRNISISRIISHILFVKKTYSLLYKLEPDIIYVKIPPNLLIKSLYKFKKKKNVKIILDIYDLWPESFPNIRKLTIPLFYIWKNLRDKYLFIADKIITECALYKEKLYLTNADVIYLAQEDYQNFKLKKVTLNHQLDICYLGSISHLLDIPLTISFLKNLNVLKKIKLHIIGDGELRQRFLDELKNNNISYSYYGVVFDSQKKLEIMSKCQFGLNIMIDSAIVGLSNKSVEYFKTGLILINSIGYDTQNMINDYNTGFNICNENIEKVAKKVALLDAKQINDLKLNSRNLFLKQFSEEVFKNRIIAIFKNLESK